VRLVVSRRERLADELRVQTNLASARLALRTVGVAERSARDTHDDKEVRRSRPARPAQSRG